MIAPSFRPPSAVCMWADDENIYVEIPAKVVGVPPYITKYPLSEGGLAKALQTLRTKREEAKRFGKREADQKETFHKAKSHPLVKKVKDSFTQEERAAAKEVIRKLKHD